MTQAKKTKRLKAIFLFLFAFFVLAALVVYFISIYHKN